MHLLSSVSLWWILPILVGAAVLSWFFYKQENWIKSKSKNLKYSLITLRTLSISLISILLLGILLERTHFETEKPIILTLIDRSASMKNYKESPQLERTLTAYQKDLEATLGQDCQLETWHFGQQLHFPKKGFSAQQTNMQVAFDAAANQYLNANLGAIILISDGNYNTGQHPMYAAEHLPLCSIYGLSVGDTTLKKDLILSNVAYNDLTFLNNTFPIEIDIEAQRFSGKTITAALYEDGKKMSSKTLQIPNSRSSRNTITFEHKALRPGIHEYQIRILPLKGEFSIQNNQRTVYIEVLDSRSKVLLYSYAPHPDISALQQALSGNQLNEVVVKHAGQLDIAKLADYDLVVWHDPGKMFNNDFYAAIQKYAIPVWYIFGTQTEQQIAAKLAKGLQLDLRQQQEEIQASFNTGFSIYEPNSEWLELLPSFAPLTKKFGETKAKSGTQVLLKQRVGTIQKEQPLVGFYQQNQQREAYLIGEGIWRWRLIAHLKKQSHDAFDQFASEIASYLMVKKEGSGLRVQAPKKRSTYERCVLNASFYNEALQPITSPLVYWELKDANNKVRKGTFSIKGSYYQQQLGQLKAGRYYWRAYTSHNQKKYVKSGAFVVEDIQLEQLESAARHTTLYQLATQSNGKVYPLRAYDKLLQRIQQQKELVALRTETHQFDPLLDLLSLLLILVGLLVTEWFLRRYHGSY